MEKRILQICGEKVGKFEQEGGACRQALLARCARAINRLTDNEYEALDPAVQEWSNAAIEAMKRHESIDEFPGGEGPSKAKTVAAEDSADEPAEMEEDMATKPKKGAGKKAPAKETKKAAKPAAKKDKAPAKAASKAKTNGHANGSALESKPKRAKTNPGLGEGRKYVMARQDHKIRVEVDANPKRAGSAAAARFDLYKDGMSVEKAIAAGVTALDISFDLARNYISLSSKE